MNTLTFGQVGWAVGIAACYALWGILCKFLQVSGPWAITMILLGSVVGGIGVAYPTMRNHEAPALLPLGALFVAGLLNGMAMHFHAGKMLEVAVPTVSFIVVIIIAMVVMTPVYDFFLNHEVLTARQWLGVVLALITVYVLVG